jgi:hypothetical protein
MGWLFHSPAGRRPPATPPPLPVLPALPPAEAAPPPAPAAVAAAPDIDPVVEAAQHSAAARRGLSTRRDLYVRTVRTRRLLRAWDRLGAFVAPPGRPLARGEGSQLNRVLQELIGLLERFPLMGEAGQPGYLASMLAHQEQVPQRFRALEAGQREALARDWEAGRKLLTAHLAFVRREIRAARRRGWRARLARLTYAALTDLPVAVLLLLALLAIGAALWRSY